MGYLSLAGILFICVLLCLFIYEKTRNINIFLPEQEDFFWCIVYKEKVASSSNFYRIIPNNSDHKQYIHDLLGPLLSQQEGKRVIGDILITFSFTGNILTIIGWKLHIKEILSELKVFVDYRSNAFSYHNIPPKLSDNNPISCMPIINEKLYEYNSEIYRKIGFIETNEEKTGFIRLFSNLEWRRLKSHIKKLDIIKNFPIPFLFVDRKGKIILTSNVLMDTFKITNHLDSISDFYDELRGTILPDTISFQNYKKKILQIISQLDKPEEVIYNTLQNTFICQFIHPIDDETIVFFYQDITNTVSTNRQIEELQTEFKEILGNVNKIVLIVEKDEIVESNTSSLCIGEKINIQNHVKNNKFFLGSQVYEFYTVQLSKSKTCYILDKEKADASFFTHELDVIYKKLILIGNTIKLLTSDNIEEKSKLLTYYFFNINCSINRIKILLHPSTNSQSIEFIEFFNHILEGAKEFLTLKNFEFIHDENQYFIELIPEFFSEFIYKIIEILYKNQFNKKKIYCRTNNNNLYVTLEGLIMETDEEIFLKDVLTRSNHFSHISFDTPEIIIQIPLQTTS